MSKIKQEVLQSNLEKGLYAYSAANMEGVDVSSIFGSCEKVEIFLLKYLKMYWP
jgi:hypothetical protein